MDVCVAFLAERHQVVRVECHLQLFQSLEVREGHSVVYIYSGRYLVVLQTYLAYRVLVKVCQAHGLPLCCGVDLLPSLPLFVLWFP